MFLRNTISLTLLMLNFNQIVHATVNHSASQAQYLEPTVYLDFQHPAIQGVVAPLLDTNPQTTAIRIHNFVRDEIRFGWTRRFYKMTASDVLRARVGYCNTKSTLFVALLRAAGIPARPRFVTISSTVLEPFLSLPQTVVDHSFTEVRLNNRWHRVDSYIPDPALFAAAKSALNDTQEFGYGIHRDGVNEWDGNSDAFAQWTPAAGVIDYGIFEDTQDFYAKERRAESMRGLYRFLIPFGAVRASRAVDQFVQQAHANLP